ncbi:MAG: hypothetical protein ABJA67_11590 [Chthonomonadales bacterium]
MRAVVVKEIGDDAEQPVGALTFAAPGIMVFPRTLQNILNQIPAIGCRVSSPT